MAHTSLLTAFLALVFSLNTFAEGSRSWTRILTNVDAFARRPGIPFVVAAVDYEDSMLSALCWYRYAVGKDSVTLHGSRQANGQFWPRVIYEVAIEGKTKWKQIRADLAQTGPQKMIVSPDNPVAKLSVSMEPFRQCMGIYRYGRVVLETGEGAILALDDLLPTADANTDSSDFKSEILQLDEDKKAEGFRDAWLREPAELSTITSFGDRVVGDFLYEVKSSNEARLEGTRTSDGDFWPRVTFWAAHSNGEWKAIGKSHHGGTLATLKIPSGDAERVRVVLSDYKPLISKYKYGKIVFSNGHFGVFSIALLRTKK